MSEQGRHDTGEGVGALMLLRGMETRAGVQLADLEWPADASERTFTLDGVASRGFHPPGILSVRALETEADAEAQAGDGAPEGVRVSWSLLYRVGSRLIRNEDDASRPAAIYLLGVNAPKGATESELDEFRAFYDDVHLPEVAGRRNATAATRYELVRAVKRPYPTTPGFLAIYEMDERAASQRRHAGGAYAAGPPVWHAHTTPWRLWYATR